MASNVHELYQKRKHEGTEDSADVLKHKKSKVVHCHCFLAGKHIFIFVNVNGQLMAAQELQNR